MVPPARNTDFSTYRWVRWSDAGPWEPAEVTNEGLCLGPGMPRSLRPFAIGPALMFPQAVPPGLLTELERFRTPEPVEIEGSLLLDGEEARLLLAALDIVRRRAAAGDLDALALLPDVAGKPSSSPGRED